MFDLKDEDVFWCTADIGWVTGHSYIVYGPLQNGATVLMYEGAPMHPGPDRFWRIIEKHKVNILYTAPTALRAFMRLGRRASAEAYAMQSLRLLGTVGEPINPEAWMWYREVIGRRRCPIVDTWWQTETGAIMVSPLPGATPTKPGSATRPLPGIAADVVDKDGNPVAAGRRAGSWWCGGRGRRCCGRSTAIQRVTRRRIFRRYRVFTSLATGRRKDADGYLWIMGRIDDVLNVSGHRLSTMEVESALVAHPKVAEAAVVGRPDEIKGQAIAAFVTLQEGYAATSELKEELRQWVAKEIGSLAKPDDIRFSEALPKTRSGKIMRRLLREVALGGEVKGDTTTLEDLNVITRLRQQDEE